MTGVEVTPISGTIWLQPRASLGVSPAASSVTCQRMDPVSESKAYTESCSVAANTTLCADPDTLSRETYSGWPSTLPSTGKIRSRPKLEETTLARVSADSERFWPVRLRPFLYVSTSVPAGTLPFVTSSAAPRLVVLPTVSETTTAKLL